MTKKNTISCFSHLLALLVVVLSISAGSWAQTTASGGMIVGDVLDPSGLAVPNLEVRIRNKDTNYERIATTDEAGRFAVGPLALGTYEVSVKPPNMEQSSQEVYVSLGGRSAADFKLGMKPMQESITVVGESPTGIEPAQTFSKSILTDLQLRNLPAPGRRIKNLFLLTPATQIEPECGGFSISGQKGIFINLNVDGSDYTSSHFCGHIEAGPVFTIEALQEFQVLRSTFSAEFGRSTGGVINLATKTGTNELHGSLFYLNRGAALTARDPFQREQINHGNQFGGSAGGPLKKDRTFFFSAAEIQYNNKPVQVLYSVLDQYNLRGAAGAQALLGVAPERGFTAVGNSQSYVNRIDHRVSDSHSLVGRFDFNWSKISNSIPTTTTFINNNGLPSDSVTSRDVENAAPTSNRINYTGMFQFTSVLSPSSTNELRFERVHDYRPWDPGNGPEVTVRDGSPVQTIAIYGPQATGMSYGNLGYRFEDDRYQFIDNYSVVTGSHTMKLGVDANLVNTSIRFNPGYNGIYRFDTLADYLARNPAQYQQFAGAGGVNTHKNQIAVYLQDEWRLRPGLTISPGFRYEMAFLPDYLKPTQPANRFPLAKTIPNDTEMYGPRLGLAWDIRNDAKTVIRAASGVFYAPPYITLWEQALASNGGNPEISSSVTLNNTAQAPGAIQNAFRGFGVNLAGAALNSLPVFTTEQLNQLSAPENRVNNGTVFYFDPNFKLPRSLQFRVALERQVARGVTASVDYTQIAVSRMDRVRNLNLLPPTPNAAGRPIYTNLALAANAPLRPYPKYLFAYVTESSSRSLYRSMSATVNVRRQHFTIDGAYTLGYSKSMDDHENGGYSAANFVDAYNIQNEYNWSNIDERHIFSSSGVFFLPLGFELSASARYNSGRPFSPRTGIDSNLDGVVNDRPVLNGQVVRRNTYRNKGFADTSARIQKSFTFSSEKRKVLVSAEMFNLFNFANVEIGSAQFAYGDNLAVPTANPLFGRVKDAKGDYLLNSVLRTTPFQVQLGMRFEF